MHPFPVYSISGEAKDSSVFVTAVSKIGQFQQSWPMLNIERKDNSLAGKVAREQCADFIRFNFSSGGTGLADVDYAASAFQCSAVMAVPIWDVSGSHVSGVLSLGLAIGSPSEDQK